MQLFLILCSQCQQETGLATTNKNILAEMTYKCHQCGQEGNGSDNYKQTDRSKYLEGFELMEPEEKDKE
ncbi:protein of unknown function (DUF2296 domain) [endosymbiont DhMRE of Dentiscutata heterogama]|uniref:hypothetical protein n=1 Tax=endosymbiont DhMRE of Dentiscutata heterogama TaxID=1609546 RepID=UPI000629D900|nr:hypothetical protein [endosymbiont DhMRE of Dentiscutata heterogama]CFW93272.1 protein of unknown function (DUF2296 domain) [endosymbiont DhMRE of Dentiscutata heterogama]